ncbi:MAG: hypothetical protein OJF49_004119 [Ktedonobacterales bacterium]|nr:MAG: hypothetical protein OJF49_004119 [Ktedonobacterales bacterium]
MHAPIASARARPHRALIRQNTGAPIAHSRAEDTLQASVA